MFEFEDPDPPVLNPRLIDALAATSDESEGVRAILLGVVVLLHARMVGIGIAPAAPRDSRYPTVRRSRVLVASAGG